MNRFVIAVAMAAFLTGPIVTASRADTQPIAFELMRTAFLGGTEIIDVTPDGRTLATTSRNGPEVALYDLTNVSQVEASRLCGLPLRGIGDPTSVAIHPSGTYGLVTVKRDPGVGAVLAFEIPTCRLLWRASVGIGPDAVAISPDGQLAAIAVEDEETEVSNSGTCPKSNHRPGRVDILSLNGQQAPDVRPVAINLRGIAGVNCQSDPQPEFVVIDPTSSLAYVTLQENNALAVVDLRGARVASVVSMGTTTHAANTSGSSFSNRFTGRREPDGVGISADGRFLFTADEGDTSMTGSIYSGGRTMTVLTSGSGVGASQSAAAPRIVADTGASIEQTAQSYRALTQDRASHRGPEPDGILVFKVQQSEFAALSLERANAVILYDVTNPTSPSVAGFIPTGASPEGLAYIPGRRLLLVANEGNGSLSIICARVDGIGCSGS